MSALAPPPAPAKGKRYSMATVNQARTMYAGGWTISQIRDYLRGHGHASLSENTVRWWVRPGEAEHYRKANLARYHARKGRPRDVPVSVAVDIDVSSAPRRLRRLRALRDAGLTFTAVAKVYELDTGVGLSAEQVRYLLSKRARRGLSPLWERKLMGAT